MHCIFYEWQKKLDTCRAFLLRQDFALNWPRCAVRST